MFKNLEYFFTYFSIWNVVDNYMVSCFHPDKTVLFWYQNWLAVAKVYPSLHNDLADV